MTGTINTQTTQVDQTNQTNVETPVLQRFVFEFVDGQQMTIIDCDYCSAARRAREAYWEYRH